MLPSGSPATYFSVYVNNQDKNETDFCLINGDGYYMIDLALYENGYSINDDITASVLFVGFSGSNSSVVSSNSSDKIDIQLSDIQKPELEIEEAPDNITLGSDFNILAFVNDNTDIDEVSLFIKNPGDSIFTELSMIQDDGASNDWNSDEMASFHTFGQSTQHSIPETSSIGMIEYYVQTDDGTFTVTDPAINPQNNAYEIEVLDTIAPFLIHTQITTLEAGETHDIIATVSDNLDKLDEITMYVKEVGQSIFTAHEMLFNGNPNKYNATMPAQNVLGTLEYYIQCNDTSNNTVRLPASGSWDITVLDTTIPEIIHSLINSVNAFEPINFTCQVSEIVELDKVWINITDVHGAEFNESMLDAGGGNWYYLDATGQDQIGTMNYTIWANDTSENLASISHSVAVNDAGTPLIFHDAPAYLDYNISNTISAYVMDSLTLDTVSLAYEPVGSNDFTVIPMTSTDSDGKQGNFSADIPPQVLGSMRYYINATDDEGNNITWPAIGPPYNIDVIDTIPPSISNLSYSIFRAAGTPSDIQVNVTDNHLVDTVILHYLNDTSDAWISLDMTNTDNDTYEGIIPAHEPGLVRFYISANDSSDNNATLPVDLPKLTPYNILNYDISIPEVELDLPDSMGVNQTIPVFVNVSDDQEVTSVQLFYSGTEDASFSDISVSKIGDDAYKGILPVQNISGEVQVYAMVSDGLNNNQSQVNSILVINQPPEIQHIAVESAPVGENVAMIAQVSDDLHIESVYFYWRNIGESQYKNLTMNQTVFGTYRTDLSFHDAVIIQYHIVAFDAENSTTSPDTLDYEINIMDLEAPKIIHQPLDQLNISSMPIISATVTDNKAISSVNVWYRNSTASTFFSATMTPVSGSQDMYTALLEKQPEGNFTYYIEASDGFNTATTEQYTVEVMDNSGTNWTAILMFILLIILLVVAMIIVLTHLKRKPKPIKEVDNPPEK